MGDAAALEAQLKARIPDLWPSFLERRKDWLRPGERFGRHPEKAAENIITDLFCEVLDWRRDSINYQVGRSDSVHGI
jgi:hypothetical protein